MLAIYKYNKKFMKYLESVFPRRYRISLIKILSKESWYKDSFSISYIHMKTVGKVESELEELSKDIMTPLLQ